MRRYENIVIIDPDLKEEQRKLIFQKLRDIITQMDGLLVKLEEWGNRKLAYEIKKKPRGYYIRIDFCGSGALVNELERNLQIDDKVLKYMTVLLDAEADLEQIKDIIAAEEAKAVSAAAKAVAIKQAAVASEQDAVANEDESNAPEEAAQTTPAEAVSATTETEKAETEKAE